MRLTRKLVVNIILGNKISGHEQSPDDSASTRNCWPRPRMSKCEETMGHCNDISTSYPAGWLIFFQIFFNKMLNGKIHLPVDRIFPVMLEYSR